MKTPSLFAILLGEEKSKKELKLNNEKIIRFGFFYFLNLTVHVIIRG